MPRPPPRSTLFPYTTLFRSVDRRLDHGHVRQRRRIGGRCVVAAVAGVADLSRVAGLGQDRKSTRLNSSHSQTSYAVFCLKKKSTRLNSSHVYISYAVFCLKKKKTKYIFKPHQTPPQHHTI